jgi:hypothetical protein
VARSFSAFLVVALALGAAACSGTTRRVEAPQSLPPPVRRELDAGVDAPTAPAVYEDEATPDGSPCAGPSECSEGRMCRGPRGCMSDWACGEPITCGADRIAYCDCEGITFYAFSGCAGRPYAHVGACDSNALAEVELGIPDGDEPITEADRICESNADCRRGETCFGPSGCGVTLRCQRVRGCAGPRETFCSCEGETFTASAACPGRSYLRRGECEGMIARTEPELDAGADGGARVAIRDGLDAGVPSSGGRDGGSRVVASARDAGALAAAAPDAGARWASTTLADGSHTCRTNRDCRRPEVCTGAPGCGEVWTCRRPVEACMSDTQYFCDCERETFTASMTCPGRPFAHRGSCAIDQLLDLAGGSTH